MFSERYVSCDIRVFRDYVDERKGRKNDGKNLFLKK